MLQIASKARVKVTDVTAVTRIGFTKRTLVTLTLALDASGALNLRTPLARPCFGRVAPMTHRRHEDRAQSAP